ncbi:hypothetical protein CHCC14821_0536 [Bacillus paralicheniformis]|nr:hypothetical protein CHCC14821_0536 [Bacillus paralicheniformis]
MKKTLFLKRVIRMNAITDRKYLKRWASNKMNLAVERSGTYEWGVGGCSRTG